ncbi:MAG: MBOAT family protein [Anaerolineales bacterium]
MSFTSLTFWIFFALVFSLHYLARTKSTQNIILLIASYVFYAWLHPGYALMLGLSTLADYFIARLMTKSRRKKGWLALSLLINLGALAFFKYYDFFVETFTTSEQTFFRIILPVGLSFYTLKKLSYILDIYRGTLHPNPNLLSFGLYVSFFPQITAGPIDRYQKLMPQIETTRRWEAGNFYAAWPLLVTGFFKKLVIANGVGPMVKRIFHLTDPTIAMVLVAALGFTLQILADFSAYTDMSRGIARLLGFKTSENFKNPYLALTPTEFWNRWHITLSHWLRDYIFFPIHRALLRRRNKIHPWLAASIPPLATMLVSGVWHGAGWTFIAWGGMYGILIVLYQSLDIRGNWKPKNKLKLFLAWLVMFSFIVFGWILFAAPSLSWVANVFANSFLGNIQQQTVTLLVFSLVAVYAVPMIIKTALDHFVHPESWLHTLYLALATVITIFYINSASPDFIYFQF